MVGEVIFEVLKDEVDGGYTANALGYGIHTQGETLEELRAMVKDAVACYFDDAMDTPRIIRLHFVRDEVLVDEAASGCRRPATCEGAARARV